MLKIRDDGYQRGVASIVYSFFDKKTPGGADKNEIVQNRWLKNYTKQLLENLKKKKCIHLL